MKFFFRYSFIIAIIFFNCHLNAQPSFRYLEKLTVSDGLSSNDVSDMVQDGNGFLWIGTSYGLNRYDGTEVTKYFAENNGHSLANNKINDLELVSCHVLIDGYSFFNLILASSFLNCQLMVAFLLLR